MALKIVIVGGVAGGAIQVNEHLQTSNPDIYAIGDAIEVTDFVTGDPAVIPLAGPANHQARITVDHLFGRNVRYPGTLGTSIVRVFDLAAASTGANEKALKRLGIVYRKSVVHPMSHADYFPHAAPGSKPDSRRADTRGIRLRTYSKRIEPAGG